MLNGGGNTFVSHNIESILINPIFKHCYQSEPMSIQRKTVHACQAKTQSPKLCCVMPLYFW